MGGCGGDRAARDGHGDTALMGAAVLCQDIRILEMLLKAGADISAADDMTQTALTYAAANTKNPAVVAFLLDAGADARTPRMT